MENNNFPKSIDRVPILKNWLDKYAMKRIVFWFLIFLAIIWIYALFLDLPIVQPIFNPSYISSYKLNSYPMWGYSLFIILFGSVNHVVIFQSILGALAISALMVRLNCLFPRAKTITTVLFIFALPWLSYMLYAYQVPISSAFIVLMLLSLELAIQTKKITWSIFAGVLAGFGQNFRSELFLLPLAILFSIIILRKLKLFRNITTKPLIIFASIALLLQIPWALNCYFNSGRFSFTESNSGYVAYLFLGLPSNPWNIEQSDSLIQEKVNVAGLKCSALSFQGSDYLMQIFFNDIKQNPTAYFRCLIERTTKTIIQPFSSLNLASSPTEMKMAEVLRLSHLMNWKHFNTIITNNRSLLEPSTVSIWKIISIIFYEATTTMLGSLISVCGICGFFLSIRTGPFKLNQPLLLFLFFVILYRISLNIIVGASGKYMTSVYLCYLPFVVNTLWYIHEKWLHSWIVSIRRVRK